jgi:Peptidase A4 family
MYNMQLDASMQLVPTNLPGVFAKVRDIDNVSEPLNIAPLIDSRLLARLQQTETPAARVFRERILSRRWRREDQITPLLKPQTGVTHPLTSRTKTANTSFTSKNWAGGTIQGAWGSAFGIWRVPTVAKPSTPPGTSGGWNSSSWVGIDGTYGSNDVLQAGIQQQVSSSGDASYVAWFEWFAPKQANSPPYIFQTNIDNIRIEPGDEVFCGVYYVGRQGEIIFGNIDRGHYFSMVLAPPPGASFSGNSSEWIMESPNGGEPGTSLPRFTPVVFSTAFATGTNSTTGNPANGDATNILGFGETLTSVSLRQDALEIDDIGSGWLHNLPSAAQGAVPVAPGTSPTSWYTTPENVQHIAHIGTDGLVHELFFRIGSNQGWLHNLPSAAQGAVPVAPGTSPTSWYTTPENVQHIAYVGVDRLIHELFFRIGANQGWFHNLPSAAQGAVPVAPGTSPTSWYTTPENVQHIAYVGTDGLIHELFFRIGANQGWFHNLPSAAQGAVPVASGTSPTSWYTTPENVQHIAYVGNDRLIHELFFRIGANQGWFHNLPSAAQGAVPVAPRTSPTSWYTTPENVQHIAHVGTDGLIHELFFRIGANQGWFHNLPSAAQGAVPVAPGTSPTSWYTTPENVQHIAHVGTDGLIHELFFRIGANQGWFQNLPSAAQGAVPVAVGTSPTSWYTTPENIQHIAHVGNDRLIHELFFRIA